MLKFYGYKKCSTCRKAEKALQENGLSYEFIDITENPPGESELRMIVNASGLEVKKAFNTSGQQYKADGWKDKIKQLTDNEKLRQLVGQGKLMKRPMVTDGQRATIGFNEAIFKETWG